MKIESGKNRNAGSAVFGFFQKVCARRCQRGVFTICSGGEIFMVVVRQTQQPRGFRAIRPVVEVRQSDTSRKSIRTI